jgi:hypothetical protein
MRTAAYVPFEAPVYVATMQFQPYTNDSRNTRITGGALFPFGCIAEA